MPRIYQNNPQANNTSIYLKFLKILFAAVALSAAIIALTAYATASPIVFLGYAFNTAFILLDLLLLTWFLKNIEALVFRRVDDAFQDQVIEANVLAEPNNLAANQHPLAVENLLQQPRQAAQGPAFFQAPARQPERAEARQDDALRPFNR